MQMGNLVLERRPGETILIGRDIRVTLARVGADGKCRIAVEAPKHVRVDRLEVREQKELAKRMDALEASAK